MLLLATAGSKWLLRPDSALQARRQRFRRFWCLVPGGRFSMLQADTKPGGARTRACLLLSRERRERPRGRLRVGREAGVSDSMAVISARSSPLRPTTEQRMAIAEPRLQACGVRQDLDQDHPRGQGRAERFDSSNLRCMMLASMEHAEIKTVGSLREWDMLHLREQPTVPLSR